MISPVIVAGYLIALIPGRAVAQHGGSTGGQDHQMSGMTGPLGIGMQRFGSGTSWLPDLSPMYSAHYQVGSWGLMLHGVVFGNYDYQSDDRGDEQLNSTNWGMLSASRNVGGGFLTLRAMVSAEPLTVGARGYPLLLQSGEAYQGEPIHDRQHPHDLFMEIAALYDLPLGDNVAASFYLAPVGEPALGPVAFPHRPSALNNPIAPLGHHWQDATHITFGVITVGLFTKTLKVEGSIFNGREPDEDRYDFDYQDRRLDSYAGRVSFNPSARWSLSGSYGYLDSPEELEPGLTVKRVSASVLHQMPIGSKGHWAAAAVFGANWHPGDRWQPSILLESNLDLDGKNAIFGRVEQVEKEAEELVVPLEGRFKVRQVSLGYLRRFAAGLGVEVSVGVAASLNVVPSDLESFYGSRTPYGLLGFLQVRPGKQSHGGSMMMDDSDMSH